MNDWTSPDGTVRLIHGDCVQVLPTLEGIDAILTDPPYGIGVNHNMGRRAGDKPSDYTPATWDKEAPDRECFDAMFAVSKHQIIWGANHFIDCINKRSSCWLVWNKLFSPDVSFASAELAWTSLSGVVKRFDYSSQRKNGVHPTQKPVALMEWCLGFLPDAQIICDPYMGSGTTGVACIRTKRRFTGIEISRHYWDIAVERCKRELDRFPLFKQPAKPKQNALFD